jgi:hypothetical protein
MRPESRACVQARGLRFASRSTQASTWTRSTSKVTDPRWLKVLTGNFLPSGWVKFTTILVNHALRCSLSSPSDSCASTRRFTSGGLFQPTRCFRRPAHLPWHERCVRREASCTAGPTKTPVLYGIRHERGTHEAIQNNHPETAQIHAPRAPGTPLLCLPGLPP